MVLLSKPYLTLAMALKRPWQRWE